MNEIIKETYKASYFESETSKGNRRYLPLSVWARKGFDEKRIEQIDDKKWDEEMPVSYTHLTLPTICSV